MSLLESLARTPKFRDGLQNARAELIVWLLAKKLGHENGVSISDVQKAFVDLDLVRPRVDRLRSHFKTSRKIRTLSLGVYAPTRDFTLENENLIPDVKELPKEIFDISELQIPPFVDEQRKDDLSIMMKAYTQLFMLENSMRGLIKHVLENHLGDNWWDKAANSAMKRKHETRLQNEKTKKWAPARSDHGPLYSIDWSDLITLMRKYEAQFLPYIHDINFLHRFDDAGMFRNVIAHNGVLRKQDDLELIRIYYRNWIEQLS